MDCKHRIVCCAVYSVQLFVYFNKSMTKYCIVKKCKNNSSCKNVSFFKIPKNCAWLDLLRFGDSRVYPSKVVFAQTILKKEILLRGQNQV